MIQPFLDPVRALSGPEGRWLLLGKGPSFARLADCDPAGRRICTLNHVIERQSADLAHVADLDVVAQCGEAILRNAGLLVMPWRPHDAGFRASPVTLEALAADHPVLGPLAAEGRLLCYNLSTGRGLPPHPDAPWIETDLFSGAVVANLLVQAGAREVRTLGVDGGGRYAEAFQELETVTLLSHGAPSFDSQFTRFAALGRQRGLVWGPLYAEAPLRVAIVAGPEEQLAAAVLAHGLARRTAAKVAVEVLDPGRMAVAPGDLARRVGGAGRVLRLEADLMPIGDLLPFWAADLDGAAALADATGGAILIDAAHPVWATDATFPPATAPDSLAVSPVLRFEGETRPWRDGDASAVGMAWRADLRDGLASGMIPLDLPCRAIRDGFADLATFASVTSLDATEAKAALDDPAHWCAVVSEALTDPTARRRAPLQTPRGWRSWPGRLMRRGAGWWDARLKAG